MPTYKIDVTRTTIEKVELELDAPSPDEAEDKAFVEAKNSTDWKTDDYADYEITQITEIENDDPEDDPEDEIEDEIEDDEIEDDEINETEDEAVSDDPYPEEDELEDEPKT